MKSTGEIPPLPPRGSGGAAGDRRGRDDALDRGACGVEQPRDIEDGRGGHEPAPLVGLVPDDPPADPRVARRSLLRELGEVGGRARRHVRARGRRSPSLAFPRARGSARCPGRATRRARRPGAPSRRCPPGSRCAASRGSRGRPPRPCRGAGSRAPRRCPGPNISHASSVIPTLSPGAAVTRAGTPTAAAASTAHTMARRRATRIDPSGPIGRATSVFRRSLRAVSAARPRSCRRASRRSS